MQVQSHLMCQQENHAEEEIVAICLFPSCQFQQRFLCLNCLTSEHSIHGKHSLKLKDIKHKNKEFINQNWPIDTQLSQKLKLFINTPLIDDTQFIIDYLEQQKKQLCNQLDKILKEIQIEIQNYQNNFVNSQKEMQKMLLEYLQFDDFYQDLLDFSNEKSAQNELTEKMSTYFKNIGQQEESYKLKIKELKKGIGKQNINLSLLNEEFDLIKNTLQNIQQDFFKKEIKIKFQAAEAYQSAKSLVFSDLKQTVHFKNHTNQAVAYTNILPNVSLNLSFKVLTKFKSHFVIGFRQDSNKDEESYNKSPYFCLHCNVGSLINLSKKIDQPNDSFDLKFIPNFGIQVHFNQQIIGQMKYNFQNDKYRLYFWKNKCQWESSISLITIKQE